MEVNYVNNVSFGRISFADKSVKKAFYLSLDNPKFTSRDSRNRSIMYCLSKWLITKENKRHDRLLKIGMKQIEGRDYFTNAATDEVLGTTKRGRQNIVNFLAELMFPKSKKV